MDKFQRCEFCEFSGFSHNIKTLLTRGGHQKLQEMRLDDPEHGAIIPGAGGARKLRFQRPGIGKRGGLRIIYYYKRSIPKIWFIFVYDKSSAADLNKNQKQKLKAIIDMCKTED